MYKIFDRVSLPNTEWFRNKGRFFRIREYQTL